MLTKSTIFMLLNFLIMSAQATVPLPPFPQIPNQAGGQTCNDADVKTLIGNIMYISTLGSFIQTCSGNIKNAQLNIQTTQNNIKNMQNLIAQEAAASNAILDENGGSLAKTKNEIYALQKELPLFEQLSQNALCNARGATYLVGPLSTVLATAQPGTGQGSMTQDQYNAVNCATEQLAKCINNDTSPSAYPYCPSDLTTVVNQNAGQYICATQNLKSCPPSPLSISVPVDFAADTLTMAQDALVAVQPELTQMQQLVASTNAQIQAKLAVIKGYGAELTQHKINIDNFKAQIAQYQKNIDQIKQSSAENKDALVAAKNAIVNLTDTIKQAKNIQKTNSDGKTITVYQVCPQYVQAMLTGI